MNAVLTSWWWWWEIGAALVSIICTLLIIILLARIDGMALNKWLFPLQPNTLLAVLTTVTKTSLLVPVASCISQLKWQHYMQRPRPLNQFQLIDDASRGPWGSVIIICHFIGRVRSSVVLGLAIISILALGIDPSVQQIIRFESKEIKVANNSVLSSRTDAYFSRTFDVIPRRKRVEPASRCTWDDMSTLGICGRFRDITASVTQNCTIDNKNSIHNNNIPFHDDTQFLGGYTKNGTCDFWYPKSASISSGDTLHPYPPISLNYSDRFDETLDPFYVTIRTTTAGVLGISRADTSATIGTIWMVKIEDAVSDFDGTKFNPFQSYAIDFYWCNRTLHGVIASSQGISYDSISTEPWIIDVNNEGESVLTYDETHHILLFCGQGDGPKYNISKNAFTGMASMPDSLVIEPLTYTKYNSSNPATLIKESPPASDPSTHVSEFMRTNDMEKLTANLADAFTAYILEPGGDNINAAKVTGYMFTKETVMNVQWAWLTLLVFETLFICVLLIITIFLTGRQPLLKNSAVALLFHGLLGWDTKELNIPLPETLESLDELAQRMTVRLEEDQSGSLKFIRGHEDK
ncbi:hypothetical protein M426DRAFT_260422 [Hypoxylon sp. CI-4A]|nr:hypothetical protein M426DRAFT_260422 [Hypoxylon sp. CI-4A]